MCRWLGCAIRRVGSCRDALRWRDVLLVPQSATGGAWRSWRGLPPPSMRSAPGSRGTFGAPDAIGTRESRHPLRCVFDYAFTDLAPDRGRKRRHFLMCCEAHFGAVLMSKTPAYLWSDVDEELPSLRRSVWGR